MNLVHFSSATEIEPRTVEQSNSVAHFKPAGLWVSDEDDYGWGEWCKDNDYPHLGENAFKVVLAPDANLLVLTTAREVAALSGVDGAYSMRFDWTPITSKYQGILITPYQWSVRLAVMWYYAWDCASGCIWDAAAIESVVPITVPAPT